MYYLDRLWGKVRHSSPLRLLADGLARLGIDIAPYYVFLEGLAYANTANMNNDLDGYLTVSLGPGDMKRIAQIPGRPFTEQDLIRRLNEGCKCFGVMYKEELAAFTWANCEKFSSSSSHSFTLESDEAYLFDAYTLMPFRGKGLAPYVRYQCYKELAALGRHKLYSMSVYFNRPAVQFKRKLNAQFHELYVSVSMGRRWQFIRLLKKYNKKSDRGSHTQGVKPRAELSDNP